MRRRTQASLETMSGPLKAGIYGRVSTVSQRGKQTDTDEDNKRSLIDQERDCRALCRERGYVVQEEYVVREVSSGNNLFRPKMEELYSAAKQGKIDLIVLLNVSRFARSHENAIYQFIRATKEMHLCIEFVETPPSDKLTKFYQTYKSMFAEEYRDEVMRNTQEKRRERVTKRGLLMPGSWPMYGYVWDDPVKKGRYLEDKEAADVVRRIFALVLEGRSVQGIARQLNAEGILCPSQYHASKGRFPIGRPIATSWRRSVIARILHTPAYWGRHAAYRWEAHTVVEQDDLTGRYHEYHERRLREETDALRVELPPEVCPPLVDAWIAEAAHARLAQNKCQASKTGGNRQAVLRGGYLRCGYCGKPMYCMSNPPNLPRYYCRSHREKKEGLRTALCPGGDFSVRHDRLDTAVWQDLVHFFSETSWLERVWAAEQARQAQTQDKRAQDLEDIKKSLAGKEAEANELVEMVRHITTAAMRTKLEKQINEVGQELEILLKEKAALEHPPLNRETLESNRQAFLVWAEQALGGMEASDVEKKRVALYWLGVDVVLFRSTRELVYEVTLTWRGLNAGQPLVLREAQNADSSM